MANKENCNIVADAIEKSVTYDQTTLAFIAIHRLVLADIQCSCLDPEFYHFDTTIASTAFYFCKVDGKLVEKKIEEEAGKLLGFDKK